MNKSRNHHKGSLPAYQTKAILISFLMTMLLVTYSMARDRYLCFYSTAFESLTTEENNRDIVFKTLMAKLTEMCRFDTTDIFYCPKQSSSKAGLDMYLDLMSIDSASDIENHLLFVLNGFSAKDTCFTPLSTNPAKDAFAFSMLSKKILHFPIKSVCYLFTLKSSSPTPMLADSVCRTLFNQQSQVWQSAIISITDSTHFKQYGELPLKYFIEGIDGGADGNLDLKVGPREMESYITNILASLDSLPPIFLKQQTVSSDSFALVVIPKSLAPFSLNRFEGSTFNYDSTAISKPCIILFGATYCMPCQAEKADIKKFIRQNPRSNFMVIYVSLDSPDQLQAARSQAQNYPFVFLHDPLRTVFSKYCINESLPLTLIVNKAGRIMYRKHGYNRAVDQRIIERYLKRIAGSSN